MVITVRHIKMRQFCVAELKFNVASFGNLKCIFNRFGAKSESIKHFIFALEIKFLSAEFKTCVFSQGVVGLNADKNLLHFCIGPINVMSIVCCNERNARFF